LPADPPQPSGRDWVPFVAAASLVLGFAVAQATGARWLGAIVLVAGGMWCAVTMWRIVGPARMAVVAVVYVVAFIVSHPLGRVIGPWPAVIVVAVVTGLVAYAMMRPTSSRVSRTSPPTNSMR
jgi:hypothetical protein